jgi:putative acetyltransferase
MTFPDDRKIDDFILPVPIMINSASQRDYPAIIELWELYVRASHLFLPEDYLQRIKKLLPSILEAVKLFVHLENDQKTITGFLGVTDEKIEMLFIHPDKRGQGIGTYKKIGYEVVGRTEVDGLGKPFPLLQMALVK